MRKINKKLISLALVAAMTGVIAGCGKSDQTSDNSSSMYTMKDGGQASAGASASTQAVANGEIPAGMYLSELTGEPISDELKNQRPVAVMVDNEKTALLHYGTDESDIVYEMMNSTLNKRITRLMCIIKDWGKIEQLGSIRSTRPTNIILAAEYDAVLCHDGGPFYNNDWFKKPWSVHFSGTFSRVSNGKSREFTEYVVKGDLDKNFQRSGVSTEYNEYRVDDGKHFNFAPYGQTVDVKGAEGAVEAKDIKLPFYHNGSELKYNEQTGTYDYYEYGSIHKDAEDGKPLTFKNLFIQDCDFTQLDPNGYLIYNCISQKMMNGWYVTNGYARPMVWNKKDDQTLTKYYDAKSGEEIQVNAGKSYVTLIPSDTWSEVEIQ